jgi:hypothetical protein
VQLPVLQIPEPCGAHWDSMSGDERERFCQKCQKSVVSLYEQTDREVRVTLALASQRGDLCVHTRRTKDGGLVNRTTRQQQLVGALLALAEKRRGGP